MAFALQFIVDFVDCEGEVGDIDGHQDKALVLEVARGVGYGLGVAGTDKDAVEDGLNPRCSQGNEDLPDKEGKDRLKGDVCAGEHGSAARSCTLDKNEKNKNQH